jgi:hypothetical protein
MKITRANPETPVFWGYLPKTSKRSHTFMHGFLDTTFVDIPFFGIGPIHLLRKLILDSLFSFIQIKFKGNFETGKRG